MQQVKLSVLIMSLVNDVFKNMVEYRNINSDYLSDVNSIRLYNKSSCIFFNPPLSSPQIVCCPTTGSTYGGTTIGTGMTVITSAPYGYSDFAYNGTNICACTTQYSSTFYWGNGAGAHVLTTINLNVASECSFPVV